MNSHATTSPSRDSNVPLMVIVAVLAGAAAWFVGHKLHYWTEYSIESYSPYFWPRRIGLILHLSGGAIALTTGLIQIWLGLTHRVSALHRILGKVYAAGIVLASIGGFYLGFTIPGHFAYSTGLMALDTAWLITTGMALYAIHLRQFEQHREWMIRSYTVTFAFVVFRFGTDWVHQITQVPDDAVADDIDTTMAWACWAVPLMLAEVLIQLRAMRRSASP